MIGRPSSVHSETPVVQNETLPLDFYIILTNFLTFLNIVRNSPSYKNRGIFPK